MKQTSSTITNLLEFKKRLNLCPELGWQEVKTTEYIATRMPHPPIARGLRGTPAGLVYCLGNPHTPAILIRADIDALPGPHGPQHLCGHSTHTAALMQTLIDTKKMEQALIERGKSILFLFQPAEETYPSGAQAFISEHASLMTNVIYAFAVHVRPLMKLGLIGLQAGPLWARGDYFEFAVSGRSAHIKNHQEGIDAIAASTQLVAGVKGIQKRFPRTIRMNIGTIQAGRSANTVADQALMTGDCRLKQITDQRKIKQALRQLADSVSRKTKAQIRLTYHTGTPPVINNPSLSRALSVALPTYMRGFDILSEGLFSFGCEDFAYISERVPSAVALIGTGDTHDIHTTECTISDGGTEAVYRYFSFLTQWWLNHKK